MRLSLNLLFVSGLGFSRSLGLRFKVQSLPVEGRRFRVWSEVRCGASESWGYRIRALVGVL